MNTKIGKTLRELRGIAGLTQAALAVMIGASKDTVASWEVGRNKLSRQFARRIALATGVNEEDLRRGRHPLTTQGAKAGPERMTAETFRQHRERLWGGSDEAAARRQARNCADALELILAAAARASGDTGPRRLPAVLESFVQWCEQTREDFELGGAIEEQLAERKNQVAVNQTYGEWRRKQKEDPIACRAMGFKDDPQKDDKEQLRLSMETVPVWRPGHAMRGGRGQG